MKPNGTLGKENILVKYGIDKDAALIISLAFLCWFASAIIDAVILKEGSLVRQLFFPSPAALSLRLAIVFLAGLLIFLSWQQKQAVRGNAALLDLDPNPVMEINSSGAAVYINPAAKRILQESGEGVSPLVFMPDDWKQLLADAGLGGGNKFVYRELKLAGKVYQQVVSVCRECSRIRVYATDVTERLRTEQELKAACEKLRVIQYRLLQSNKMAVIGQLARGVAHEINNPLTGVLNNVQLVRMQMDEAASNPADFKEILNTVEESALRCRNVIRSLLDFSRITADMSQVFSLNQLIEGIVVLFNYEMMLQNIAVEKCLDPALPKIMADKQLLQQVVFNLLFNAKWAIENKAGKGKRVIKIATVYNLKENVVCFSIEDTGIGIPKENLEHIFEPFFTTKKEGEGVGLGLAIVRQILSQHKAAISLESREGEGSNFTVRIPVPEIMQ